MKARLDTFKGSDTVSVCIDRMITFFEITGFNPRYASRNPTALVEKRIEDVVRIIKSQERDILKPVLEKLSAINNTPQESPDYARLMNELRDLKDENRKLKERLQADDLRMEGAAVYQDKLKRLAELVKYQLDPEKFPRIKYSDDVRVPVNTLQLLIKKINEEYVL
ncbi:mobilization protein [Bacteroides fragilis]|nr:mobilization protein [Bacteroides fragilis]